VSGHAALHVEALTVAYGARPVIDKLTLPPFGRGTVTALVGPNGAGKSTVLKAFAQILPSSGTIRLDAADLRKLPPRERARTIGFMPQGVPPNAELTVIESVVVSLQAGQDRADIEKRAVAVLQHVSLAELALRPLNRLSGGERQLVSLAQATALSPPLLFLDEPTSALDLARQYDVMRLVRTFAREGAAVVMVMHDLTLAAHWADKVVVLDRGMLHSAGAPSEVITAAMLKDVYGVSASIETIGGRLFVAPPDRDAAIHANEWKTQG
jgi:iron complex transport system ATP-binding protein